MKYVTFNKEVKVGIEDLQVFNDITSVPMDLDTANNIFKKLKDMFVSTVDFSSDDGMFSGHYDNLTFRKVPTRTLDDDGNVIIHMYTRDMTTQDKQYASMVNKYNELKQMFDALQNKLDAMTQRLDSMEATATPSENVDPEFTTDTETTEETSSANKEEVITNGNNNDGNSN